MGKQTAIFILTRSAASAYFGRLLFELHITNARVTEGKRTRRGADILGSLRLVVLA